MVASTEVSLLLYGKDKSKLSLSFWPLYLPVLHQIVYIKSTSVKIFVTLILKELLLSRPILICGEVLHLSLEARILN